MSCDHFLEALSAHVDGTLPSPERAELEAHLAGCPACRVRLESLRAVKHAVARLPSREAPPGAVRARVEALRFARRRSRACVLAAVATAAALGAAGMLLTRRPSGPPVALAEELVGDHLRSVPEAMPAEVTSHDPKEVIAFFAGRVPFAPAAPVFLNSQLVGGRLCHIDGRRVQLLFYDAGGEKLSLYVSDRDLGDGGCRQSRGHHVCSRRVGDRSLILVGRLPSEQLLRLLEEAARSEAARTGGHG
jgi:anti-sigma factor RsiW